MAINHLQQQQNEEKKTHAQRLCFFDKRVYPFELDLMNWITQLSLLELFKAKELENKATRSRLSLDSYRRHGYSITRQKLFSYSYSFSL